MDSFAYNMQQIFMHTSVTIAAYITAPIALSYRKKIRDKRKERKNNIFSQEFKRQATEKYSMTHF